MLTPEVNCTNFGFAIILHVDLCNKPEFQMLLAIKKLKKKKKKKKPGKSLFKDIDHYNKNKSKT